MSFYFSYYSRDYNIDTRYFTVCFVSGHGVLWLFPAWGLLSFLSQSICICNYISEVFNCISLNIFLYQSFSSSHLRLQLRKFAWLFIFLCLKSKIQVSDQVCLQTLLFYHLYIEASTPLVWHVLYLQCLVYRMFFMYQNQRQWPSARASKDK